MNGEGQGMKLGRGEGMARHVVLLSRDASLADALRTLLDETDQVTQLRSPAQWSTLPGEPVDAVVVDMAPARRRTAVEQVRAWFKGRMVLLVGQGDEPPDLPEDPVTAT